MNDAMDNARKWTEVAMKQKEATDNADQDD